MSEYVITTDNNSDLPDSFLEKYQVGCVYLSYTLNDKTYVHGDFLPDKEFYDAMRAGSMPTTAQVNPDAAKELMLPYLKEGKDILHIAFSSGLSGSYNSARVAAEELREEFPDRKIEVVDSLAASLGEGLAVYEAVMRKVQGASLEEVKEWVESNRDHFVHIFTVDSLDHLYRGGRVSKTTAIVGGMLNIKPVLHVDGEGKLVAIGKVRGRKKSLLALVEEMNKKIGSYKDKCHTIFISHGDCQEDAQFVVDKIKETYDIQTVVMNSIGATIGAHSGPGTVALFFMGDEK